jgi:hypothetical protein
MNVMVVGGGVGGVEKKEGNNKEEGHGRNEER